MGSLSGLRLLCHCTERQSGHADRLTPMLMQSVFPTAFGRSDLGASPPSSQQVNYLARLREELESGRGFEVQTKVMQAKVVDGEEWSAPCRSVLVTQSVMTAMDKTHASPGRWSVAARRYPETDAWKDVVALF